jgi:phage virion morphogenesis protein
MTGVGIRVDDAVVMAAFGQIEAGLVDMLPAFDAIGASLVGSTVHRFETETGPDGNPWPPSLRALKEGGQTLTETARLRQSITHLASADGAEVGTNVVYAAIHQLGGTIKREARTQTIYRKYDEKLDELLPRFVKRSKSNFATDHAVGAHEIEMPARPFLGIDDADQVEIGAILIDHFTLSAGTPS